MKERRATTTARVVAVMTFLLIPFHPGCAEQPSPSPSPTSTPSRTDTPDGSAGKGSPPPVEGSGTKAPPSEEGS